MSGWRNKPPRYQITNEELIPFLSTYVPASEWVIELTGGEPTLYSGFEDLLYWLSNAGYYTLVKTNGTNPIAHYENVKICSAFHRLNEPPKYYDDILIVDKVQREEKESYCKEHNIPYHVVGFYQEDPDGMTHKFANFAFINPDGYNPGCQAGKRFCLENDNDGNNRITNREFVYNACCPTCKTAIDAWRFLPDEIKARRFQHTWH